MLLTDDARLSACVFVSVVLRRVTGETSALAPARATTDRRPARGTSFGARSRWGCTEVRLILPLLFSGGR
eukprot:scaffold34531_cov85-Phaeocystis_antarctica.AAC.1